jgi:oligopeptide transport system substrate-binding protein
MRVLRLATLALAALLAVPLAAALPASAASVLNRGTGAEPTSLDPHKGFAGSAVIILYDLFQGLMTPDAAGKATFGQAESFTVSPDGLVYTFKLRPNLQWSDGVALTAEDFVYSMRRALDPKTASRLASQLYPIKGARAVNRGAPPETLGVRALDPRTVQITLESPKVFFPDILISIIAAPVPRHVIEKLGDEWTKPGNLVSNGAFMLKEYVPQSYIRAEKNAKFWDAGNVKLDAVVYTPTEDLGTSLRRFRAKELDIALNFPPDQIGWIKENLKTELKTAPALGIYYFLLNTAKPPFDDVRVRKALSMAIDRQGMIDRVLKNDVIPAWGVVPGAVSGTTPRTDPMAGKSMGERQAAARALLTEAGYGPGKPLKFTLRYNTLEENRIIAVTLAAMWKPLGVEVTLQNADFRAITQAAQQGDFEMLNYTWYAPYDDPTAFLTVLGSGNPNNRSFYSNAAYDKLLAETDGMTDAGKRLAALKQAEDMAMADEPLIPLYFYVNRSLVHKEVKGWVPNPKSANLARFLSVER